MSSVARTNGTPMPQVVVDPRERSPWPFSVAWTRGPVPVGGNYSVVGFEDVICVGRCSLDDFVGELVHNRDAFLESVESLTRRRWCQLVVEGSLEDLLAGRYQSRANPNSLAGAVAALIADGAPVLFAGNANAAAGFAERLLVKFHKRASRNAEQRPAPRRA
jgi:ERCC4-type nuclease